MSDPIDREHQQRDRAKVVEAIVFVVMLPFAWVYSQIRRLLGKSD